MADASLALFQDLSTGQRLGSITVDVVLRPYAPALQFAPVIERLTSPGADGYRSRLIYRQPRPFEMVGLIGEASPAAARSKAQLLQDMMGSYGKVTFTQNGLTVVLSPCQIEEIEAQPRNETLATVTTEYSDLVAFRAVMRYTGEGA